MGTPRYGHAADDNYVYYSGYHYASFPEVGDTIHTTLNTMRGMLSKGHGVILKQIISSLEDMEMLSTTMVLFMFWWANL